MALFSDEQNFYLSGGASNSDPLLSLGGARSTTEVHESESTVTSTSVTGALALFDTSLGGSDDDHNGKYVLVLNSASSNVFASQITDYRASDGRMTLRDQLPATVTSGDTYRMFVPNSVFDDVTAARSALGTSEYRGIYHRNEGGEMMRDTGYFIQEIGGHAGPFTYDIWTHRNGHASNSFPSFVDTEVGPTEAALDGVDINTDYDRSPNYSVAKLNCPRLPPPSGLAVLNFNTHRILYIRRNLPTNTPAVNAHSAVLVIAEGLDNASSAQVKSAFVLTFGADGFTPDVTPRVDRTPYINGGFRAEVNVKALESGLNVPDYEVGFQLASGPGTLNLSFSEGRTDENGDAFASYIAPTDQGQAGQIPVVEVRA